jgi:hypothetical protein
MRTGNGEGDGAWLAAGACRGLVMSPKPGRKASLEDGIATARPPNGRSKDRTYTLDRAILRPPVFLLFDNPVPKTRRGDVDAWPFPPAVMIPLDLPVTGSPI